MAGNRESDVILGFSKSFSETWWRSSVVKKNRIPNKDKGTYQPLALPARGKCFSSVTQYGLVCATHFSRAFTIFEKNTGCADHKTEKITSFNQWKLPDVTKRVVAKPREKFPTTCVRSRLCPSSPAMSR